MITKSKLHRSYRLLSGSVAAALVITLSGLGENSQAQADPGGNGKGNHYGLKLVTAPPTVDRSLVDDPYGAAAQVAMSNPDDFGFPTVVDGIVVLPAVSDTAIAITKHTPPGQVKKLNSFANNRKVKAGDTKTDPADLSKRLSHVKVTAAPGTHTVTQMFALNDQVFDMQSEPAFADADIMSSGIDGNGQVLLTVRTLTDDLAATISDRFGADMVVIQEDPDLIMTNLARPSDTAPFHGGAAIVTPLGACTSAFIWNINSTTKGMLTAGHCIPDGGTVKSPGGVVMGTVATDGSADSYSGTTGSHYFKGSTTYRGDLALVTMTASVQVPPRTFTGNSSSNTSVLVGEMWSRTPAVGDQYCTGGAVSGELCGWTITTVGTDYTVQNGYYGNVYTVTSRHVTAGTKAGSCAQNGDSGGPVYTVRPDGEIAAKGVINSGGTSGSTCTSLFTDIYDAYYGLPGTLATA